MKGSLLAWHGVALAVFALASGIVFGELWERGPSRVAPYRAVAEELRALEQIARADVVFESWLVARNAHTWLTAPHRLFEAEHCAPVENTLTLGVPMLTMGLLAIPAHAISGDPVFTYSVALVLLSLASALAAYALLVSWTGVPAAGIVAGLLLGYHASRLGVIGHPAERDLAWTALALLFAERLSAGGRWRDAIGLGAAIALQIGASFYSLLAATLLAPPFAVWLGWRDRMRHVRGAQIAFVAVATVAAASFVLGPYLLAPAAESGMERQTFAFAPLSAYLPGGPHFPGFAAVLLAGVGVASARWGARLPMAGHPAAALAVGGALVALVAAGPIYRVLADGVPGLAAIRVVERLSEGVQLALAVLAGLGVAALVRASGRFGPLAAALLVAVVAIDTLRPPLLGLSAPYTWDYVEVAPDPEEIAFFEELARRGNTGPLLEVPVTYGLELGGPPRILLSAWHGRRTSACFGSYAPAGRDVLLGWTRKLPDREAVEALAEMGFTTVVYRKGESRAPAPRPRHGFRTLYTDGVRSAFALEPRSSTSR